MYVHCHMCMRLADAPINSESVDSDQESWNCFRFFLIMEGFTRNKVAVTEGKFGEGGATIQAVQGFVMPSIATITVLHCSP